MGIGHRFGQQHDNGFQNGTDDEIVTSMDRHYFKRVNAWHGTVVWPHHQDMCPDTLYLESQKIPYTKYKARVKMTQYRQVEFELPDEVDTHTVEIQAQREASQHYGESDEIEVLKVEVEG